LLTAGSFLVLPFIQAITKEKSEKLIVRDADTAYVPPPDSPPPTEPEPEPEEEPEPPKMQEALPDLDRSQLEFALNAGSSSGSWIQGDFGIKLDMRRGGGAADDAVFQLADLDQRPRATYQPSPRMNARMRTRAPGKVYILFVVNERGRVETPIVQQSTDAIFDRAAISAVKKWKFEPGKRKGKPVRFRMRLPLAFPKG
jgi:protein TonB